jgi:hypothetical protein
LLDRHEQMRRILPHITAIAALTALGLSVQLAVVASTWGAAAIGGGAAANPALNKQVQEALAKAQAQKAAGGAGSGEAGNGNSFSKLTEKSGEEEATTRTSKQKTESSSGALSTGVLLPLLIVGGGVLAGIAFLILRDARGVTPAGDLFAATGNAEARAARLRKRRAKAKAARRQRKRNR